MTTDPHEVLVVEDDPDIVEAMVFVLEDAGYRVSVAENGSQALDRLRAVPAPCLILLDLMMPIMDGWQLLAELSRDPRLAAIPVVVVTGAGKAVRRAPPAGARDMLEKPVSLDRLLGTVQRHCA